MNPGGKAANQATAVARLKGEVNFIVKVGDDTHGKCLCREFEKNNVYMEHVLKDQEHPTGVALITVDREGQNSILVAAGANAYLSPEDIKNALAIIAESEILLLQLEIPLETVEYAVEFASNKKVKVILDPAPSKEMPSSLLHQIDIITPNEHEAEILSGISVNNNTIKAAKIIQEKGVGAVLITKGERGAVLCTETDCQVLPTNKVEVKDTTGAGDVFNGALAVGLANGKSLVEAVKLANHVAGISVGQEGPKHLFLT